MQLYFIPTELGICSCNFVVFISSSSCLLSSCCIGFNVLSKSINILNGSVPCEDKNHQYIGQTKRLMKIRVKEHEWSCLGDLSDLQPDLTNYNEIPYHCATTGHKFCFDDTKILAVEKNHLKRIIEGVHIFNKEESCINLISGYKIDNSWAPLLKDLRLC